MSFTPDRAHLRRPASAIAKAALRELLCRLGLIRKINFRGAFATYEEAIRSVRPETHAGYDNDAIADTSFEEMCKIALWDWPILYRLKELIPETNCILDIGGHQGTKYRAFHHHLNLSNGPQWVICDVPAVVRAGKARAAKDGITGLSFIDDLSKAPHSEVLLASGLFQYVNLQFDELIACLPSQPKHVLLNKVATREGPMVVTLEDFRTAEVPYQIRNRSEFEASLVRAGYSIVDKWETGLSHSIASHPHLGVSRSFGYFARLRDSRQLP